jgi:hypothetical protein
MSSVNRNYKEIYDRILILFPFVFFKRERLRNWKHLRVFVVDVLFSNTTIDYQQYLRCILKRRITNCVELSINIHKVLKIIFLFWKDTKLK